MFKSLVMASQSTKKLANANAETLKQLHLVSLAINALVLAVLFIFKRPGSIKPYVFFSIPAFFLQYWIEKSGRPVYAPEQSTNIVKLVRAGDDINRAGLYEYFFDTIYVTWILDVLMIILGTNKVWYLYGVIPAYAGYLIFGIAAPFLKKSPQAAPEKEAAPTKSKRQQKLEARKEKGPQMKYK